MREAYRTNKNVLYKYLDDNNVKLAIMLIYIGREMPDHDQTNDKIILTLQRLCEEHSALKKTATQ